MLDPIEIILSTLKSNRQILNTKSPISDSFQAQGIYDNIMRCESLSKLKVEFALALENRPPLNFNHPDIFYAFGNRFLTFNDKENAKYAFKKAGTFGINYPCLFYNSGHIDSIGQSLANLTIRFSSIENDKAFKLVALSYIFLSRCIELMPNAAFDSYYKRALLLVSMNNDYSIDNLIIPKVPEPGIQILLCLSDFFQTSFTRGNPHSNVINEGEKLLLILKKNNFFYQGKNINTFSIKEITDYGQAIHKILFKILEAEFQNGMFDLKQYEIESL